MNARKQEILKELKGYETAVKDLLEKFNPDYTVDSYKSYDYYGFNIFHTTKNWNSFVSVQIDIDGKARFSHSTGPWKDEVSQEDRMEATVECFNIAKAIMDMKEEISQIVRKMNKLTFELDNLLEKELNEEMNSAKAAALKELNSKYEKITAEEVIEKLQTQPNLKLVKLTNYNRESKKFDRLEFIVANYGFGSNSRMNLYVQIPHTDVGGRYSYDESKISKKTLEDYVAGAYLVIETAA